MSEAMDLPPIGRLRDLLFDAARLGRADMVPALIQAGVAVDVVDARGHTPLVLASYHGHDDTTALLLAHGAAVDGAADASGNTALMGVCFKGYVSIARRLIDAGADVNRQNGAGQTALMMAALFGQDAVIDLLLDAGADVTVVDAAGNTALALALGQGSRAVADRLEAWTVSR